MTAAGQFERAVTHLRLTFQPRFDTHLFRSARFHAEGMDDGTSSFRHG
jgi:hypothetical protein